LQGNRLCYDIKRHARMQNHVQFWGTWLK
jgi:hypothetical protein